MTLNSAAVTACPAGYGAPGLTELSLYGDGDPHAVWSELRRTAPVSWQHVADGLGFWSIVKYADVDSVLRDHATFTSERGTMLCLLGKQDPAAGRQMAATDPPRHRELREPLQRALNVKTTQARRQPMREAVVEVLAPLADSGAYDVAAHMAMLPMAVVGAMMALPRTDWPQLVAASAASVAPDDPRCGREGGGETALKSAHRELFSYFLDLATHRRNHPGDDLISVLLGMEMGGRPLSAGEIVSNCYSLLLGANVTVAHVLPAVLAELMGSETLEEWATSPELLAIGTEEALRWASPGTHFLRHATRDTELSGQLIRAGDPVVVWLGSANRDEDVFSLPFSFDIRRRPNKHLTFGIGPHYCVGHTVARMALRLLFAELFSRYYDFRPAGPAIRMYSNIVTGWTEMPITARQRVRRRPPAY